MSHHDAWPLLDEFLDGALAADARWAVAAHLEDCPTCRQQVARQALLRRAVRAQLLAAPVPELGDRLRAATARDQPRQAAWANVPRITPLAPRIAALLGPALAAVWLLIVVMTPSGGAVQSATDFTSAHALFAQDESLFDIAGDAAAVEPWFRDKIGLTVVAPDLAGWRLAGGRLIVINGKPAAQLVYEAEPDKSYLSLLRFQEQDAADPADTASPTISRHGTLGVVSWSEGNLGTALVAALPDQELQRLAGALIGVR